jgi:hypothetical protein
MFVECATIVRLIFKMGALVKRRNSNFIDGQLFFEKIGDLR